MLTRGTHSKDELIFQYIHPATEVGGCHSVYTETYPIRDYQKVFSNIFERYDLKSMEVSCEEWEKSVEMDLDEEE